MRPLSFLYLGLSLLNIYAAATGSFSLNLATKPLLMVVLALYFLQKSREQGIILQKTWLLWIFLGIIASISGDTWLIWNDDTSFMLGLGSFLIAHVCYFIGFMRFPSSERGLLQKNPFFALPMLFLGLFLNSFLWHKLGDLRIPVMVYSSVIVAMGCGAIHLLGKTPANAARTILLGVSLFVLSDSMIALNKFNAPIPLSGVWIMLTYLLGQWFIANGALGLQKTSEE